MVKNWLITGASGFIGTSLIKHLIENNQAKKIRVFDNLSVGTREDLATVCDFSEVNISSLLTPDSSQSSNVVLVVGDIRDPATAEACCREIDVIVHLAANTGVAPSVENPRLDMECNVIGTFNMLEASRQAGVKRFVFASSGAPIGECVPPIHEELAPHPVSPYGASKLACEGYCSAYYRTFGIETVALRFGNVYGPGSSHKNSVVAKFIRQAMRGEILEIYGDGHQTRDFIYMDDLIEAICLAARVDGIGGEIFQIATFKETTVNDIARAIKEIVEKETNKKVKLTHSEPRIGDVRRNYSDISKAKKMLGFEPRYDLKRGLEETFFWFLKEG